MTNEYYNVPHKLSSTFTGREDVCKNLQDSCLPQIDRTVQKRFVIYGLGGTGKTQISLKFTQDHREKSVC